jgi:hypothetical protein
MQRWCLLTSRADDSRAAWHILIKHCGSVEALSHAFICTRRSPVGDIIINHIFTTQFCQLSIAVEPKDGRLFRGRIDSTCALNISSDIRLLVKPWLNEAYHCSDVSQNCRSPTRGGCEHRSRSSRSGCESFARCGPDEVAAGPVLDTCCRAYYAAIVKRVHRSYCPFTLCVSLHHLQ